MAKNITGSNKIIPFLYGKHFQSSGWENRLKAERAWFLTEEVRRAEPETEQLLTRWGKSCVFSESTGLSFLKQSSGPTPSDSLEE